MKKIVKVSLIFLYDEVEGKDSQYYRNKAFNEIYNGDDNVTSDSFNVDRIGEIE